MRASLPQLLSRQSSLEKSEAAVSTETCAEVMVSPVAAWLGFIRHPKSFSLTRILPVTHSKEDLQWDSDYWWVTRAGRREEERQMNHITFTSICLLAEPFSTCCSLAPIISLSDSFQAGPPCLLKLLSKGLWWFLAYQIQTALSFQSSSTFSGLTHGHPSSEPWMLGLRDSSSCGLPFFHIHWVDWDVWKRWEAWGATMESPIEI